MGVAVVEAFVDFLREGEGVDQSVLAGGALAGNDRRTFEPVPPVSSPACIRNSRIGSMLSKGTPWISTVKREVMAISPLPNRSAASEMARLSSAVIFPLRVITRPVEAVGGVFIPQKTQPLDAGNFLRRDACSGGVGLHLAEGG